MHRPVLLVSLCAAGALVLAGCSQDGGSQDDPPATAGGSPIPSPSLDSDDELASCLVGTWDLDASFLQGPLEESMTGDPTVSVSDFVFTATQTQTLEEDETFTAELAVEMTMTMTVAGQTAPVTASGTGSASGTWTLDDGEVVLTVKDRGGEGTMSGNGQTIDMPNASSLGQMMLLPTDPYPVTCSGDTMTIDVEGMSDVLAGAPDELVATRR